MPKEWDLSVAGADQATARQGPLESVHTVSGKELTETAGRFEREKLVQVDDVSSSHIHIKPARELRVIQIQCTPAPPLCVTPQRTHATPTAYPV